LAKKENREPREEKRKEVLKVAENGRFKSINKDNADDFIEAIDKLPEYKEYLDQRINMDNFRNIVQKLEKEAKKRDDKELEADSELLKKEKDDLIKKIKKYRDLVIKSPKESKVVRFSKADDFESWNERRDKKRRSCHNSIVSSLGIFKRFLKQRLPEKYGVNIDVDFFSEEELPAGLLKNVGDYKNLSGEEKDSREKIGDWAIDSALGEKLRDCRRKAKQIKKRSH
jgi:hypothetical protein